MPARKKTPPAPEASAPKEEAVPIPEKPKAPEVKLSAAKGRPMLQWVGKRPLRHVTAFPAQHVETFDPSGSGLPGGQLYYGDNKEVLAHLLAAGYRGKVDLIYIDPPFDSGADYVRKVTLKGKSAVAKLNAEAYSLGEQVQYTDIWANDNYLQFMFERLILLKELLSDRGAFWIHCDWHNCHFIRLIADEVFGAANLRNEVVWKRTGGRSDSTTFNHIHDTLFYYSKSDKFTFNGRYVPHDQAYIDKYYTFSEADGRRFATIDATQAGLRKGASGEPWRGFSPASKGNHWKFHPTELDRLDRDKRIYWPIKEGGWPRLKSYLDELKGSAIQTIWLDLKAVNSQAEEREDYPTQKPESLIERIVDACTAEDALVLDCFLGSGTTAAVAQKLGRRWIGCDINKGAIQTASKRLQGIIREQLESMADAGKQGELIPDENAAPPPAQFGFQIHRVNDYDLAIQHNEAVALACEHIGVQRTKTDTYFEGVQGKRLVKIVPFNHPLSPADLEDLKRELRSRDQEERDILIVCLGRELACQSWLDDWNRLRKKGDVPNKIEVIELRTDPKYGKFITHKPATAKVSIARKGDKLLVDVKDFASPSIIERLETQGGSLMTPQITDWRFMVDSVMIDPAWDGSAFNIALTDLPEKKGDLVSGNYELPAPKGKTTVAVKITDMLGEEVVISETV